MRIHKSSNEKFPRFGFDSTGQYISDKTCFIATGVDIKYIMAILNSIVGRYLCSKYVSILDNGGYLMQKIYLEKIPIPRVDENILQLIEKLLDAEQNINIVEDKINEIIYSLYNFTNVEIDFIESESKV